MSKQWQDFLVLIFLMAFYLYVVFHHWRGLRLPLSHGRRIVLMFTLMVWLLGIPMIFYSLGTWREFWRVLAAPFSN